MNITLITKRLGNLDYELKEALSTAILDSGCTQTVCGKTWLQCYIDTLTEKELELVKTQPSETKFKFRDGKVHQSNKKVSLPAEIGDLNVIIESDVICNDLPLLLRRSSMKKAGTRIYFERDKVIMFGIIQYSLFTSNGHYCIPLCKKRKTIESNNNNFTQILFTNTLKDKSLGEKRNIALKLYKQFSHPTSNRLKKLLLDGGVNDEQFFNIIEEI